MTKNINDSASTTTFIPSQSTIDIKDGWLVGINQQKSPFYSPRSVNDNIELLVIHNISLPAGHFGNSYINDLFMGCLDCKADNSFADLVGVEVSAHCVIKRDGQITQYVSFNDKAWHAGISNFNGKDKCNDFSIGIELEGSDDIPYEEVQYQQLAKLGASIQRAYPLVVNDNIKGHCDIAPGRKTDPGKVFNWKEFHLLLTSYNIVPNS